MKLAVLPFGASCAFLVPFLGSTNPKFESLEGNDILRRAVERALAHQRLGTAQRNPRDFHED